MEPGQTVYFPLDDYSRASIHVTLSRLRREYKDLMGGTQLPGWSLAIPTPPGDLWAVTYHGLTEGGRVTFPRPTLSEDERRLRRNATVRKYRNAVAQAQLARLLERSQNDPRLRLDAPVGYETITAEDIEAAKTPTRELSEKQLAHLAEIRANRSAKAAERRQEREERQAKEAKAERTEKARSLPEVLARLDQIESACEHYELREDQVRAQLQVARDALATAKPPHLLSSAQYARIERGESKSRYDRAEDRVKYFKRRLAHYEAKLEALDIERENLKEAREELLAVQHL
jgi:hypothetical protein